MLKKLLKYDLSSVFRYWWIAALVTFVLSLGGGSCLAFLNSGKTLPDVAEVLSIIFIIIVVIGYIAFSILTAILVYARFYKNFFTDEGYLTFTLPVRRSALLNSKLITCVIAIFATGFVCTINVLVMICIGFSEDIFSAYFWYGFTEVIREIASLEYVGYILLYIPEAIVITLLSTISSVLFIFCCITFASLITRKGKIAAAFGIYYVANGIVSFLLQILYTFGFSSIVNWMAPLPESSYFPIIALILLGVLLFMAIICMLLYTLLYWMLDRKLNLS